jgi:elongation factor P
VVSIQLPTTVELQVAETAPAIKGGSASARTKPATLNTGLVVQVPEYIATDESLKINTTTGKFMSRA